MHYCHPLTLCQTAGWWQGKEGRPGRFLPSELPRTGTPCQHRGCETLQVSILTECVRVVRHVHYFMLVKLRWKYCLRLLDQHAFLC